MRMQKLNQLNSKEIMLCRGKGCCPSLKRIAPGQVLITDDDGNKVVLTAEQAELIPEALTQLNEALLEETPKGLNA
tara:strand:+ start:1372 stop:1599 length:228 start_codon:yes stop_codon:yes gene_type:complete